MAMFRLELRNRLNRRGELGAQPRKQRLLFVTRMPFPALPKVVESSLHSADLFLCHFSAAGSLNNAAQDAKETLNSTMAVCEHSNWIVESAVRFRSNLYRHDLSSFLST
jgi:hypothetical protein